MWSALALCGGCSVQLAAKPGSSDQIAARELAASGDHDAALDRVESGLHRAQDPEIRARLLHDEAKLLIRIDPHARDRIVSALQASRALGYAPAAATLADYLMSGSAAPADVETAADLYMELHVENPMAAIRLAELIFTGAVTRPGVDPDRLVAGAAAQLRERAGAGDDGAALALARLYRDGTLSADSHDLAETYFGTAIVGGNETAVVELARMMLAAGDPRQAERARQMLEDAAGKGSVTSMAALARAHQDGSFANADLGQARHWYQRAIDTGAMSYTVPLASLVLEEEAPSPEDVQQAIALLEGPVAQGDPRAAMIRAKMHANGLGGPVDDAAAARLYQVAADGGLVPGVTALASAYAEGRGVPADLMRAVALWETAVDLGSTGALLDLGRAYAEGLGVTRDPMRAEDLLGRAVEAGSMGAAVALAELYETGIGDQPDLARALPLYRRAGEAGTLSAMRRLAELLGDPGSPVSDQAEAAVWLQRAADRQDSWAMFRLAQAYGRGSGVGRDPVASQQWVERYAAAEPGNEARIARAYEEGEFGWDNAGQAIAWYQRAAQDGDARAMRALAEAYEDGEGVSQDTERAADWLRRAAAAGDAAAMRSLAGDLADSGSSEDLAQAIALWRASAQRGDVRAMRDLAGALSASLASESDLAESVRWYEQAAAAGDGDAQYRLGMMYLQGFGVEVDSDRAREWLDLAARNNVRMATGALEALENATE